jgi:hypothetical protein
MASATVNGPFQEYSTYSIDAAARRITAVTRGGQMFFQLDGESAAQVVRASNGTIVLQY